MAQLYCTGNCLIYVGVGPSTVFVSGGGVGSTSATGANPTAIGPRLTVRSRQPVFLGTCEIAPEIYLKPYYRTIKSDDSGDMADDVAFMGEEALIYAELNRYTESVYAAISAKPAYGTTRGLNQRTDVGSLMLRERLTYPVWVVFPYVSKPIFNSNAVRPGTGERLTPMPSGYRFFECYLEQDGLPKLGTRARRIALAWRAIRPQAQILNLPLRAVPATGSDYTSRRPPGAALPRTLYDHDTTGLPAAD